MPFIENVNKDQLKVPLGFIKLPQLVLAVIAFTSRSGWEFVIQYLCANGDKKVETFDDFAITDRISKCGGGETDKILDVDHTMAARFFGLVAVVSIIFVLIMLYVYLCKWGMYAGDDRIPKLDLVITLAIAVGWFLATWIWWGATNSLEDATDPDRVADHFKKQGFCDQPRTNCDLKSYAVYAPLTVSIIAGFGSLVLFGSNVWFVYKETAWFRQRQQGAHAGGPTNFGGDLASTSDK